MVTDRIAAVNGESQEAPVYQTIDVRPVTPAIGAEVRGVDLSKPLSPHQWDEVHAAFLRHLVLFFKEQPKLTPEEQIRFGQKFGELHIHPAAPHMEGFPEVFVIHTHRGSKIHNGEWWHSDVSCDLEPPLGTILQLHVLPPTGGDTMFSNMYTAFEKLSPAMKTFLEGLTGIHESEHIYRGRYADRGVDDQGKQYPVAEHPVIRTHPETGRQALFVNSAFTTRIKGLEAGESKALLDFLFRQVENPYYQVRYKWQQYDVVMWDNRCAQHIAIWDYWPHERKGNRVTVKGDRPFFRKG